jgi:guanylate kinase
MGNGITYDPYNPQVTPLLIVISGPSGVGKDSLVERMKVRGAQFHFVVTATSRPPRSGEVHGIDYFFVSPETFEGMIEEDELLEYAVVYGQYKGIPKQQVREALASGQDVVMRLDVQGATTIKRLIPEAVLVFLSASSEEELVTRLKRRKTESDVQLQQRIETVRHEMERLPEFDYVVINRECALDEAVDQIFSIIRAEHHRVHPRQVALL